MLPIIVVGQISDTTTLPNVVVKENYLRKNAVGTRTKNWDSKNLENFTTQNLGELLQQETGIFIRSYGLGSSATIALRGGSSGHTAVLWNGLPIQSPMLGLLDLSLVPLNFIDDVSVDYGGNSAAWGNGAIGGAIALNNNFEKKPSSIVIQSGFGSFGQNDYSFKTNYRLGKITAKTRIFYSQADNDFTYQIREDLPRIRQTNARFQQKGILQEFFYNPKKNQELSLRFWGQETDRQIPPTAVQVRSLATQRDEALRGSIHWKSIQNKVVWKAKSGLFKETIHFEDPERLTDALSFFWSALAEVEAEYFLNKNQELLTGASHGWTYGDIENYVTPPQRNQTAVFASFKQKVRDWQLQINGRAEIVDGQFLPFIPSIGFGGRLIENVNIQGKVSRNYRLPTFNDLYWNPGGNINLLPESGWGQEVTITVGDVSNYSATFFNRNINNWIYWSPTELGFWSPQNLAQVWSRGFEQRFNWNFQLKKSALNLSGGIDFILSTNQVAISKPIIEKGEQLWYTPHHRAFGKVVFSHKHFQLNYNHQFTGSVRTPNFSTLDSYHIGNFSSAFNFPRKWWAGKINLSINNIWNVDYSVIEHRPMPGRNFQIQFNIKINTKK